MFQYTRGPRLDSKPNHAQERVRKKKADKSPEAYNLSKNHLIDCFHRIRNTAGKTPGPDNVRFDTFGEPTWEFKLGLLASSIKNGIYQPGPTMPFTITSPKQRTIQIANLKDRIASRACMEALTPLTEKLFVAWSYGYRPKRSHMHVFAHIEKAYDDGCVYLAHFDAKKAFDRVNVRKLRTLIRGLEAPWKVKTLAESIVQGGLKDMDDSDNPLGISQGNSLSGLLFNLYVHHCHDKEVSKHLGNEEGLQIYRYADDFVVVGKEKESVRCLMQHSMGLLQEGGLECAYEEPVNLKDGSIDVLGLTIASNGSNIEFRLPEASWSQLATKLDEALNQDFPTCLSKQVIRSWRQAVNPVTWTVEYQERLVSLLESHGLNPDPQEYLPKQDWYQDKDDLLKGFTHS